MKHFKAFVIMAFISSKIGVCDAVDCSKKYTVKAGDYCYKIAEKFGLDNNAFMQANDIPSDCLNLQVNQIVCVGKINGNNGKVLPAETTVGIQIETSQTPIVTDYWQNPIETETSEPEIVTESLEPQLGTETSEPQIVTETSEPQIGTETSEPQIVTETSEPQIGTETSEPQIVTESLEPQLGTETSEPQIVTESLEPQLGTETSEPQIVTETSEPQIGTETSEPQIMTETSEPEIVTETSEPQIDTETSEPPILTESSEPEIVTESLEPQIVTESSQIPNAKENPQTLIATKSSQISMVTKSSEGSIVTVNGNQILVDGNAYVADCVAGTGNLSLAKQVGVKVIRTYGADDTAKIFDDAEAFGLRVIAGFWMIHPDQMDYNNRTAVQNQLSLLTDFVNTYKSRSALLWWGIGNEVETAPNTNITFACQIIDEAAQLVRQLDPNHPTMTVFAEIGDNKASTLKSTAPNIQILGVNSYGDAIPNLPDRANQQDWTAPLVITELGSRGQWEAALTAWNASIEPQSDQKATLLDGYMSAVKDKVQGQCPFLWGQKQEVTPTWHSLLLADGSYEQTSEVIAAHYGGSTPNGNKAPRIGQFVFKNNQNQWPGGQEQSASLSASDPDGDQILGNFVVMLESDPNAAAEPTSFPDAILNPTINGVTIAANSLQSGNYRLFCYVRDGKGAAATANLPFQIQ